MYTLKNYKISKSGNTYYTIKFEDKRAISVTINPKFTKIGESKEPSFLLQTEATTQVPYCGKGATWVFLKKNKIVHQGNIVIDGEKYHVDIIKTKHSQDWKEVEFSLTLTRQKELEVDSL